MKYREEMLDVGDASRVSDAGTVGAGFCFTGTIHGCRIHDRQQRRQLRCSGA